MAVASPGLCAFFFILLPAIAAESGMEDYSGSGTCAESEMDTDFTCVIRMPEFRKNILLCNIMRTGMNLSEANARFTLYGKPPSSCLMESQLQGKCPLKNVELIRPVEVCLSVTTIQQCVECKTLKARDIVKPEAPFDLGIIYEEEADEYFVNFSTPHNGPYLEGKLTHELAYRQQNKHWTSRQTEFLTLKFLAKEFQLGTYEMKVRSKPNGKDFKGTWSEWSSSQFFETAAKNYNSNIIAVAASILCFFVLFAVIALIPILWKNRIKPAVWPTLPNNKKTLDKLCHKLRKNSHVSFFSPESLEYVPIHKVDSIRAKSEHLLLACDSDVPAKMGNGLEQKNLVHINHGWLKLPLAYEGMWPAEMLDKHVGRRLLAPDGDTLINANRYEEGGVGDQDGSSDALLNHASSSTHPATILPGPESNNCLQAYTDVTVPNKEEAYVTMASFFENKGNFQN
ncbi:interleukin-7 receptor subunit alpha [Lacerta agilis]|uniref:interleukin-7 receptor subunit alpha n=1 Tax=Lacerta agilis TaxID=80427 RepID=UPI0014196422|nr:interleukin-7 receptor subunit alpha [Lacerta agilis]